MERQDIINKLKAINHREACFTFFNLLKELIETTNLSNDDPRIAFTLRKDKGILASINAYSVLKIIRKNGVWIEMIFRKDDTSSFKQFLKKIELTSLSENSAYVLAKIPFDERAFFEDTKVQSAWQNCLEEIKESAISTRKKEQHIPIIYELAENENLRNELFWIIEHEDSAEKYSAEYIDKSFVSEANHAYLPKPTIPLNYILFGVAGTGKTFHAQEIVQVYDHQTLSFHQSYSYEEFVEGIRPDAQFGTINYKVIKGIFYKRCQTALLMAGYDSFTACFDDTFENRKANFEKANPVFLVIDEINRANISKVLGELISLLEPSKRLGASSELFVQLPYSQEKFGVPANLYILGTMNTSDRSIALLDTALRRRFFFKEMLPNYEMLNSEIEGIHLGKLLKKINDRIEYLLDRGHLIGHTYLLHIQNFTELCVVFKQQIIPLLQEYFYGEWEKIAQVLGGTEHQLILKKTLRSASIFDIEIEEEAIKYQYFVNPDLESGTISPLAFV